MITCPYLYSGFRFDLWCCSFPSEIFPLQLYEKVVCLGSLGEMCSPRDSRFAGSNPTEVDGFFQDVKILSTNPPGGTLSWGSCV